jgi:hypothetical protein
MGSAIEAPFQFRRRTVLWRLAGLASAAATGETHATERQKVINLLDWSGVDLTGVHDNAPQLIAAAAEVPDEGGTLQLPGGQIGLGACVPVKSGTWVRGLGANTEVVPFPVAQGFKGFNDGIHRNSIEYAAFVNVHHDQQSAITDSRYRFSDFRLGPEDRTDGSAGEGRAPANWNGHLIRLHRCEDIAIERILFRHANDGVALTACSKTSIRDCQAYDTDNVAFDHWFGGGNHEIRECSVIGCGWGVLVTGAGTFGEDGRQTRSVIDRVTVTGALQAAIMANCLTARSTVDEWHVTNCLIYGGGITPNTSPQISADGIVAQGDVRGGLIGQNKLDGVCGAPILLESEAYGEPARRGKAPSDCLVTDNFFKDCTPTTLDGKAAPLIWARGQNHKVSGNVSTGGRYSVAADLSPDTLVLRNRIPSGILGLYRFSDTR